MIIMNKYFVINLVNYICSSRLRRVMGGSSGLERIPRLPDAAAIFICLESNPVSSCSKGISKSEGI